MHRAQPQASKLLNKKWHDQQQESHQARLRSMKPTYKINQPLHHKHLVSKPKKNQMLEERYSEIERENKILLDKMTNIL